MSITQLVPSKLQERIRKLGQNDRFWIDTKKHFDSYPNMIKKAISGYKKRMGRIVPVNNTLKYVLKHRIKIISS